MTMKADLSKFRAALLAVKNQTKKPEVDIVNKALRDVAFRSASYTPKVSVSTIISTLKGGSKNALLFWLATEACNKKFGVKQWKKKERTKMARAIYRRRKGGVGALRAGWIPAIQALGGSYRGAKLLAGSASKGTAKKATVGKLVGIIKNAVVTKNFEGKNEGAGTINIAIDALSKAVRFVTTDRQSYLERRKKISKVLKANSDK